MHTQQRRTDDLGPTAEVVLFQQAQAGDAQSLNVLMERHDGLVHAAVRRQVLGDLPYAEALQVGRIGLWRAILSFDPSRGYTFSTYAWASIVHHVWRGVKVHTRTAQVLEAAVERGRFPQWRSVGCVDPAVLHMAWAIQDSVHDLVARLTQRLRYIIVAHYGLDGRGRHFYREIGEHLGMSGERARQLHTEALVWLRHPPHSQHLRFLLARHTAADYAFAERQAQHWLRRRGGRHGRP